MFKNVFFLFCFFSSLLIKASCLESVYESFAKISKSSSPQKISTKGHLSSIEYSRSIFNLIGIHNHIQGMIYIPQKDLFFVSGGDWKSEGMLLIANNKDKKSFKRLPMMSQKIIWHVGSMNLYKDFLLTTLENMNDPNNKIFETDIKILNIENIHNISEDPLSFKTNNGRYGSIDILEIENQTYLFGADVRHIDIYKKTGKGFQFHKKIQEEIFTGSYIKAFKQCNGEIFIADFRTQFHLLKYNDNYVQLYKINLLDGSFQKKERIDFYCRNICEFRGSVSVTQKGQNLSILSSNKFQEMSINTLLYKWFE